MALQIYITDHNFKIVCGISGCARTYSNIRNFRRHIKSKHEQFWLEQRHGQHVGQNILEGNVVNDDILNEIKNPGNNIPNEDENLNVNNEANMFLMTLREIHKTPQAACSFVANEFIDLMKMWRENMEKDAYAVLQRAGANTENLGQFGLQEVFQENELEQTCNLFSTFRNLQKYVA